MIKTYYINHCMGHIQKSTKDTLITIMTAKEIEALERIYYAGKVNFDGILFEDAGSFCAHVLRNHTKETQVSLVRFDDGEHGGIDQLICVV